MKLVTSLKGFEDYFDLKAILTDKKGKKVIDTVTKNGDFNGKFVFKFGKDELPGKKSKKKSSLKLTIESLNDSDETNLAKNGNFFTFDPLKQSEKFKLKKSRKKPKLSFSPEGDLIDSDPEDPTDGDKTGPVFTSPTTVDPITEGLTAGQVIYLAQATDESLPIKYSVTGKDASSFDVNPNSGSVSLKTNTDQSKQPNYGFNVVATDNKGNPTSQALSLLINKDLPPTFDSPTTVEPLKEGSAKGSIVYSASATDAGGPVTYSLTGADAASFQITPNTGVVVTQTELNHDTKTSYSFNVVATESGFKKQQTVLPLTLQVTKAGATITKIVGQDILPPETTNFSDTITCELGTFDLLGNTVQDPSTTDRDDISIKTSQFNRFTDIFNGFGSTFINIENFQVQSSNDPGGAPSLEKITNGKSFEFVRPSTFTGALNINSWGTPGITNFDFSGVTSNLGVSLLNANSNLPTNTASIKVSGTPGPDTFEGLAGDVHFLGGSGVDTLTGSTAGKSTIAGGAGKDIISFVALNKQNTVDLTRQTTSASEDTVTGFAGATAVNKANGSFDLIQINDGSFPNYTAGAKLQTKTLAQAVTSPSLANTVIEVANRADIANQVLPNAPKGMLAYATATGTLHYAPTGNFFAITEDLLDLSGAIAGFSIPDQIQVVSGVA